MRRLHSSAGRARCSPIRPIRHMGTAATTTVRLSRCASTSVPQRGHSDDSTPATPSVTCATPAPHVPAPTTSPTAHLLSLNHLQRMLRRLPVGQSSSLFHFNELPSNIQSKVPAAALQQLKAWESNAPHLASARDGAQTERGGGAARSNSDSARLSPTPSPATEQVHRAPPHRFRPAQLLRLHEPLLVPSSTAYYALFRRAAKARHARLEHQKHATRRQSGCNGGEGTGAPLDYLQQLEEPALLLPDTRHASATLGLSLDRSTAQDVVSAAPEKGRGVENRVNTAAVGAQLDAFHLGLVSESTHYRVDYAAQPQSYVLGVPTELLEMQRRPLKSGDDSAAVGARTCPERSPVDLARWVVYDEASAQFLLRRAHSSVAVNVGAATSAVQQDASVTYQSLLEEQVFLTHTYQLDLKNAYQAALAAHKLPLPSSAKAKEQRTAPGRFSASGTASRDFSCGYTLFFFHFARSKERLLAGSAQNAGLLYPSCFFSYKSEVMTTQALAAEHADEAHAPLCASAEMPGDQQTSSARSSSLSPHQRVGVATGSAPHAAFSVFVPLSGKRFRIAAAATANAARGGGASVVATSWSAQTDRPARAAPPHASTALVPVQGGVGGVTDASVPSFSEPYGGAVERVNRADADTDSKGNPRASEGQILAQINSAFQEWKGIVAARAAISASSSSVQAEAESGLHSPSTAAAAGANGASLPATLIERRLDAERLALAQGDAEEVGLVGAWRRGRRCNAAPIAVAMPIVYDATMSLRPTSAFTEARLWRLLQPVKAAVSTQADGLGHPIVAPSWSVDDAPLADAVWRALYCPASLPASTLSSSCSSSSSSSSGNSLSLLPPQCGPSSSPLAFCCGGGAVLPLAEDRVATARYRVFLPFLCTPRCVRPSVALASDVAIAHHTARPVDAPAHGTPAAQVRGVEGDSISGVHCCHCPVLWHVDELERVCGWRRFRSHFLQPFGNFSVLLNHDLYISLGRSAPPMPSSPSAHRRGYDLSVVDAEATWRSPVVWINDSAYVRCVLVPAMRIFDKRTTKRVKGNLCVYRGLPITEEGEGGAEQPPMKHPQRGSPSVPSRTCSSREAAQQDDPDRPHGVKFVGAKAMEPAVAVGVHHRMLSVALQQLKETSPDELGAWLTPSPGTSLSNAEMSRRTGVPEPYLVFFEEAARRAAESERSGADTASPRVAALLALTPARIGVVLLRDFLTWASLCSDFSPLSLEALRRHGAVVREKFSVKDFVIAAKYCTQYPQQLCIEGGSGSTVAVIV